MSTPFERGQQRIEKAIEDQREQGYTLQEACRILGALYLEELTNLQEKAKKAGNSGRSQHVLEENLEFFKGMLSRLD